MKHKKKCVIILIFLILFTLHTKVFAMQEVMDSQMDALNISSFIKEANKYAKGTFQDIEVGDLLNSAIKGDVNTGIIYNTIWGILGKEVLEALKVLRRNFSNYNYT